MLDLTNTIDILGEQTTFDQLVERNLTSFVDDSITSLRESCFYYNTTIQSIILPNCTNIDSNNCFSNASSLHTLGLSSPVNKSDIIPELNNLTHIIFFSNSVPQFYLNMFSIYSMIGNHRGDIYVPDNLVDEYKNATNWCLLSDMIYSINDYDENVVHTNYDIDTITDTWAEIAANELNGTYNTKYHIGDTKTIQVGTQFYQFEIIGFDVDTLSDESGYAKITWAAKYIQDMYYGYDLRAYPSSATNYLTSIVDNDLRSLIKEVKKPWCDADKTEKILNAKIWQLSAQEVGSTEYETSGITYSIFTDDNSRKKSDNWMKSLFNVQTGARYHLRTRYSITYYNVVILANTGKIDHASSLDSSNHYRYIGFCT